MVITKVNNTLIIWTLLNAVWWLVSIFSDFQYGIDVNPWLYDLGEVVLNGCVYIFGMIVILVGHTEDYISNEESKDDADEN